jgi:5-methylcytosine-specific restriction endonuclease McrA
MTKEEVQEVVKNPSTYAEAANNLNISIGSLRYWLNKYNLKMVFKSRSIRVDDNNNKCSRCKTIQNISNFYARNAGGYYPYCKECNKEIAVEKQRNFKLSCISYKGGCCENCGYNRYFGALEFHHKNPKEKDFAISNLNYYYLNDIVRNELDKCMLLCSNCHREEHARVDLEEFESSAYSL